MTYQEFDVALKLIFNRLKRQMKKKYGLDEDLTSDKMIELLEINFPTRFNLENVSTILKRIELVVMARSKIPEDEFTQLVIAIKNIEDTITRPNV